MRYQQGLHLNEKIKIYKDENEKILKLNDVICNLTFLIIIGQ